MVDLSAPDAAMIRTRLDEIEREKRVAREASPPYCAKCAWRPGWLDDKGTWVQCDACGNPKALSPPDGQTPKSHYVADDVKYINGRLAELDREAIDARNRAPVE